jgi:hypothetical protein
MAIVLNIASSSSLNHSSAKYLGVTLQPNLKWNTHIDNITSNGNKSLGYLKRNLQQSSWHVISLLYMYNQNISNFITLCMQSFCLLSIYCILAYPLMFLINPVIEEIAFPPKYRAFKRGSSINVFASLITLDISNNNLHKLSDSMIHLKQLRTFIAKNNDLNCKSIPKDFSRLRH